MTLTEFFKARTARLNMLDIKLAQGAAMCVMVIIIKLFPDILQIEMWWFVLVAALLELRPLYVFFLKKSD
ncbi:MAG: hypothetical protein NDJ18_10995 [candidate division Zixibacteria bacterium]|nr:hypothetical protein [candidate division Zixibacteria bacterium]